MPQEKINPWVIALRILFTLALIWAVVFIFSNWFIQIHLCS